MQILRTVFWVTIFAALIIFTAFNWKPVEVQLWENMIVETKVPALVITAFLLGLIPTWLLLRGTKWRLQRRINQLESAARTTAANRAGAATTTADGTVIAPEATAHGTTTSDASVEPAAPVRPEPDFTADTRTDPVPPGTR